MLLDITGEKLNMVVEWAHGAFSSISLDAAGLIALAELTTIARRTVLKGNAFYSDALVLCPGIHRQQDSTSLNGGEYPITANMTSGYVFRVENQATVHFLQRVGKTGHLTTLSVAEEKSPLMWLRPFVDLSGPFISVLLYIVPVLLTVLILAFLIVIEDYWGLGILAMLIVARLINVVLIRRRCDASWHGSKEPGQTGDLLVLLSQDRWIRMRGLTDDLKAVTSGEWLRETNFIEGSFEGCGIVIVYLTAALASNASQVGKAILIFLLLVNAGLLTLSNGSLASLQMKNRKIKVSGAPVLYKRRLNLAEQLIEETGRRDWALKMGMISDSINPGAPDPTQNGEEVQV